MRRLIDFSDYQAGLDVDTVAQTADGFWCKAGDWSWIARNGWPADDVHANAIRRLLELGKPVGSYLFVRPGWTDPATQIVQWRQNTPDGTTLAPMIDLEVPGTLSGGALTAWVNDALVVTAQQFGTTPVLYWSVRFQQENGMSVPSAPHIPMVAEYHRGYSMFAWADVSGWEQRAYSAYGGPGVPDGYSLTPLDMVWQFTSSAQVPGMPTLVDCSFCTEERFQQVTSGSLSPASTQELFTVSQYDDIMAAIAGVRQDFGNYIGAFYVRTQQLDDNVRRSTRVRLVEARGQWWITDLIGALPAPSPEMIVSATSYGYFNNDLDEHGNPIPQKWSDAAFDALVRYDQLGQAPGDPTSPGEPGAPVIDVEGSLPKATTEQLLAEIKKRAECVKAAA